MGFGFGSAAWGTGSDPVSAANPGRILAGAGLGRARLGLSMAAPGSPGAVASGARADFDPQGG